MVVCFYTTEFPPPPGTFNLPHGVAVAEDHKLVFVADRENGRIQCFDLDGIFKYIIKHQEFGPRIYGVDYCPNHGKSICPQLEIFREKIEE